MKKNIFGVFAVFALTLVLVGGGCETTTEVSGPDMGSGDDSNDPVMVDGDSGEEAMTPGQIPYDYPVVKDLDAKDGQFVLSPPGDWAMEEGKTWIYYGATVVESGENESVLKRLSGSEMTVPNAAIIPIKSGEKAKTGDILLARWTKGSGMQRALVVGGTESEPEVRYLDIDLDNPSGWGEKTDILKPNQFQKLVDGAVGVSAACLKDGAHHHINVTGMEGGKVLGVGFAGKVMTFEKSACTLLPVRPSVSAGDTVSVPNLGKFTEGTVKSVDSSIGRVFVEITFAGQPKELAVPFGDVIKGLK